MKRLPLILLTALLFIILASSYVYASWSYKYPAFVYSSATTTRSYYPVNLGYSPTAFINLKLIASTGLDTDMAIGATSLQYMPVSDRMMVVMPSLLSQSTQTVDLYTNFAPAKTVFPVIVGDGGYITRGDNAALEPASNFSFNISGYFDCAAGAGKNILYKQNALKIYISAANTVKATTLDATDAEVVTVTKAMATGTHVLVVSADGANLSITVDGGAASTAAIGAGVPNSAYDFLINQANVMPYITYYKQSVGGVELIKYQPAAMISVTTLINSDNPGTYDGVITFGTNTSITMSYGTMVSYSSTTSNSVASGGVTMETSGMPSTWFANGENVASLPFYDAFSEVSAQTGQPVVVIYFLGIIGVAFGAFLLLVMFTRSALFGVMGFNIVLFIGASMTVVPMWIPVVCLIIMFGIMYLYRQVAY